MFRFDHYCVFIETNRFAVDTLNPILLLRSACLPHRPRFYRGDKIIDWTEFDRIRAFGVGAPVQFSRKKSSIYMLSRGVDFLLITTSLTMSFRTGCLVCVVPNRSFFALALPDKDHTTTFYTPLSPNSL